MHAQIRAYTRQSFSAARRLYSGGNGGGGSHTIIGSMINSGEDAGVKKNDFSGGSGVVKKPNVTGNGGGGSQNYTIIGSMINSGGDAGVMKPGDGGVKKEKITGEGNGKITGGADHGGVEKPVTTGGCVKKEKITREGNGRSTGADQGGVEKPNVTTGANGGVEDNLTGDGNGKGGSINISIGGDQSGDVDQGEDEDGNGSGNGTGLKEHVASLCGLVDKLTQNWMPKKDKKVEDKKVVNVLPEVRVRETGELREVEYHIPMNGLVEREIWLRIAGKKLLVDGKKPASDGMPQVHYKVQEELPGGFENPKIDSKLAKGDLIVKLKSDVEGETIGSENETKNEKEP